MGITSKEKRRCCVVVLVLAVKGSDAAKGIYIGGQVSFPRVQREPIGMFWRDVDGLSLAKTFSIILVSELGQATRGHVGSTTRHFCYLGPDTWGSTCLAR